MELEIFEALTAAGVPADKARQVAESIDKAIDRRYELHARQLATRGDRAEMEARLTRTISDMQRWTVGAVFAGIAGAAAITKLL